VKIYLVLRVVTVLIGFLINKKNMNPTKIKGDRIVYQFENTTFFTATFRKNFEMKNLSQLLVIAPTQLNLTIKVSGYSNDINLPTGGSYRFNQFSNFVSFDVDMVLEVVLPSNSQVDIILDLSKHID
jgi:hypothetical protein